MMAGVNGCRKGFAIPVKAWRSSISCMHHAIWGTSVTLFVIVAQQSTKFRVSAPELPAAICMFFAYCSASAAEVISDAGWVSCSFLEEPVDIMNQLKRSYVDCSIDSGEPFS